MFYKKPSFKAVLELSDVIIYLQTRQDQHIKEIDSYKHHSEVYASKYQENILNKLLTWIFKILHGRPNTSEGDIGR